VLDTFDHARCERYMDNTLLIRLTRSVASGEVTRSTVKCAQRVILLTALPGVTL
jgi:hypothetical protein